MNPKRSIKIQYKPEGAGQYSKDHPFVITGLLPGNLRLSEEEALQIANDLIHCTVEREDFGKDNNEAEQS